MTRAIVCGGRDFTDRDAVFRALDAQREALGITAIAHGAARGVDTLAMEWAHARGVACTAFPADWERYGRAAGVRRNAAMLEKARPDLVIAFPGGRGTADMVSRAHAAGVRVVRP